jgi:hypothetical protein
MNRRNGRWLQALVGASLVVMLLAAAGGVALADSNGAPQAITSDSAVTGTITGSSAGSFAYYAIQYPGGGVDLRVQVTFTSAAIDQATGFNVYGWNGFSGQGVQQDAGYMELSYATQDPVMLEVQVYNYSEGLVVPFSIQVIGLAAEPTAVAATGSTESTPVAAAASAPEVKPAAEGTLIGSAAGAFSTFTVDYAGDQSIVTITMSLNPDDPYGAVGFDIWAPDGTLATVGAGTGTPGSRQASLQNDLAGKYLVQVYNYLEGSPLSYSVTVD